MIFFHLKFKMHFRCNNQIFYLTHPLTKFPQIKLFGKIKPEFKIPLIEILICKLQNRRNLVEQFIQRKFDLIKLQFYSQCCVFHLTGISGIGKYKSGFLTFFLLLRSRGLMILIKKAFTIIINVYSSVLCSIIKQFEIVKTSN